MRIRRAMRKKPLRRPIKNRGAKRYRQVQQKKRLIELGFTDDQIRKMNIKQIHAILLRPKKFSV